jgi:hypothetical protein
MILGLSYQGSNIGWNIAEQDAVEQVRGGWRKLHKYEFHVPHLALFDSSVLLQLFVGPWSLLQFRNLFYTDGRTPWMSDEAVARPLPSHRTT